MHYQEWVDQYKEKRLLGRYITLMDIEPILTDYSSKNQLKIVGQSVLKKPIYSLQLGTGKTKILMWSQMHGNESTTTKALFDLLVFLHSKEEKAIDFLQLFTLILIPMLNPDGAELYTRENANGIDLNRDFVNFSQPESSILMQLFRDFNPDYCFNLHDQRTIFAAGNAKNPATVSFLAPAFDEERSINDTRQKAINIIVAINSTLQKFIPNQVGRFDDTFNKNCVGDTFQSLNAATILFEAGHYPDDYEREETRKYLFIALLESLTAIHENVVVGNEIDKYLNIPQNKPLFFDYIYKNVAFCYDNSNLISNFAVQYKEEVNEGTISFVGYIAAITDLDDYFGHYEIDAKGAKFSSNLSNSPQIGQLADFSVGDAIVFEKGKYFQKH